MSDDTKIVILNWIVGSVVIAAISGIIIITIIEAIGG